MVNRRDYWRPGPACLMVRGWVAKLRIMPSGRTAAFICERAIAKKTSSSSRPAFDSTRETPSTTKSRRCPPTSISRWRMRTGFAVRSANLARSAPGQARFHGLSPGNRAPARCPPLGPRRRFFRSGRGIRGRPFSRFPAFHIESGEDPFSGDFAGVAADLFFEFVEDAVDEALGIGVGEQLREVDGLVD